jgi:hypothetical protein
MVYTCIKCGAVFDIDENCDDRFNTIQIKELDDTEYYKVHHLSVPCFMLQHNNYSKKGWIEVYKLLEQFVNNGLKPEFAKVMIQNKFKYLKRNWSITKGEKLIEIGQIKWRFTITDIKYNTAEEYCNSITKWAKNIIEDAEEIIKKIKNE